MNFQDNLLMYWKLTPGFKLPVVSNSATHLCYRWTKIMAKWKKTEKSFSFSQLVPSEAAILVKVSCAYRPGSGNIFEQFDWLWDGFPVSASNIWSLWAELAFSPPPSSNPVSQVCREAWTICRVHCGLRKLGITALETLMFMHWSDPYGVLCPGSGNMAWFSSDFCLPQAEISSAVRTFHEASP